MNLIEQLGGHEDAKTKRDQINSTLENSELLGGGDAKEGLYERLESIEQALLEYRRQHNIFEVGDKVVRRNGIEYEIHKIELVDEYDLKIFSQNMSHSYWVPKGQLRHAEPEEIKAGRRLEVK